VASLTLSNLGLAVGDQTILSEIGLWVAAGEFVALPGPSGGGRSKLLRPVARFERSTTGTISPDGQAVAGPGRHPPPEARGIVTMAPVRRPSLD
jgi:ABC-type Fe3+/spermidine/putrescine transport system ATPase subunit